MRCRHKGGINVSDIPRIGLIMVYFPWWLNQDQNRPPRTVQRELLKAETGLTDEALGPGTPLVRRDRQSCNTLTTHARARTRTAVHSPPASLLYALT
eukprot:COSAG06_NODE_197_length_20471_cov_11.067053_9_plen_97_part_00